MAQFVEDEGEVASYKDAYGRATCQPIYVTVDYFSWNTRHAANDPEAVASQTAKDGMSESVRTVAFVMKCAGENK